MTTPVSTEVTPATVYTLAWSFRPWSGGGGVVPPDGVAITVVPDDARGVVGVAVSWPGAVIQLSRIDPDGVPRRVRGATPMTGDVAIDGEAPLDVPIYYVATNLSPTGGQLTSTAVVLHSGYRAFLTHPSWFTTPLVVDLEHVPELTYAAERGIFWPLDARRPIVVTGRRRRAPTGDLVFNVGSFAERDRLLALLDDVAPVLLRAPADYGLPIDLWLSLDTAVESRPGRGWHDAIKVGAGFQVVGPPTDTGVTLSPDLAFHLLYPGAAVYPGPATYPGASWSS